MTRPVAPNAESSSSGSASDTAMTRKPQSDNAFERDMPGTGARTLAEGAIEKLRQRGGVFVDAVRATRMPMALTDPTLPGNPIVFANQSFLNLTGYSMEEVLGQQPYFMNGPDTDSRDAGLFRDILDSGQDGIVETVQYRKDGRRFVATVLLSAFKDDDGATLHHFLSWADVTRRVLAEQEAADLRQTQIALSESEAKYRSLFNSIDEGFCVVEVIFDEGGEPVDYVFLEINPAFEPQTGLAGAAGKSARALIAGHEEFWYQTYGRIALTGISERFEHRADALGRWYDVYAFRVGLPEQHHVAILFNDISERKLAERRQKFLLAELQHRVRNTLALVRSIVRRTATRSDSVEDFQRHVDGWLSAFARTQAYVTGDPEGGIDLELLVREELLAHASDGSQHISIEGPAVRLSAKQAETLGMAIHELTTNAIKHGALTSDGNKVEVSWSVEGDGNERKLHFNWIERLLDRKLEEPKRNGFGTELLDRIMRYELDAEPEIEFKPTGLEYRVVIPFPPESARPLT